MAQKSLLRWFLVIGLLAAAGLFVRWNSQRSIQTVRTARVERQDIGASVITNGKAEPIEFRDVRAEVDGQVINVWVREGDRITSGQRLFEISQKEITAEMQRMRADIADAENTLRLLKQGGTIRELDDLRSRIDIARRERDQAAKTVTDNERLLAKEAIARIELEQSRNRLVKAESDLVVLEQQLARPNDAAELTRAEARLQANQAALDLAQARLRSSLIASPLPGTVYSIAVRAGDYVKTGDLLARAGDFREIRVRVFVDEPDLGRIAKAQPVRVTWDGLPGKDWRGQVERLPSEIKDMGTRKVGEVSCSLSNPELELLPNMSLNIEIVTSSKLHVLTIPREALLASGTEQYIYLVQNGTLLKRVVETGISSLTRIEIRQGLNEGDEIVLAGETPLREGTRVRRAAA